MSEIRKTITLYDDQYNFYKELKSKKLLCAFVEYLFEWIEPTDLKWVEKVAYNSLKIRMENQRKKAGAWSIWWSNSHWGWRPTNASWELDTENKQKTSKKQTEQQAKNKEDKVKDKVYIKENNKRKYLDFVFLDDDEYSKLLNIFWKERLDKEIAKLNNYIGSSWKKYKSHYFTIRQRNQEFIQEMEKRKKETETIKQDLPTTWLLWTIQLKR